MMPLRRRQLPHPTTRAFPTAGLLRRFIQRASRVGTERRQQPCKSPQLSNLSDAAAAAAAAVPHGSINN